MGCRKILPLIWILFASCGNIKGSSGQLSHISLANPYEFWETIAPLCNGHPSKENCDDGDSVLFGGLLCVAGDQRGCELVRQSQGSDGRWWRSPRRNPDNLGQPKSFSRDMAMGVMLYLIATRDYQAATRWMKWIDDHRPCLEPQADQLTDKCAIPGPHRYCTDEVQQMCTLTPASWANMGHVWSYLGLKKHQMMKINSGADDLPGPFSLINRAKTTPLGYQLHLVAAEILMKLRMDIQQDHRETAAAAIVARQPRNPFFQFLTRTNPIDVWSQVVDLCPKPGDPPARRFQWSWERDTAEAAWTESMVWDCIFMGRLLAAQI